MKRSLIEVDKTYVGADARVRKITKIATDNGGEFVVYRRADGAVGSVYMSTFQRWAVGFADAS